MATTTSAIRRGTRARAAGSCCRSSATRPGLPEAATPAGAGRSASRIRPRSRWRYHVELDPAEIPKAMWAEVSPDGGSSGRPAAATCSPIAPSAISRAASDARRCAPSRGSRGPCRRRGSAGPPSTATACWSPGARPPGFEVTSIDLATGARRLEIQRPARAGARGARRRRGPRRRAALDRPPVVGPGQRPAALRAHGTARPAPPLGSSGQADGRTPDPRAVPRDARRPSRPRGGGARGRPLGPHRRRRNRAHGAAPPALRASAGDRHARGPARRRRHAARRGRGDRPRAGRPGCRAAGRSRRPSRPRRPRFRDPARYGDRSAGPERLGQDDAHPCHRGRATDPRRHRRGARTAGRDARAAPSGRLRHADAVGLSRPHGGRQRALLLRCARRSGRARGAGARGGGPGRPERRSGRAALRWASSPASPSPARCSADPELHRARRAHRRARSGAAPRPLAAVPRARGRRRDVARVESRDGRGGALRPAAAPARGAPGGRRHPWRAPGAHGHRQLGGRVPAHVEREGVVE